MTNQSNPSGEALSREDEVGTTLVSGKEGRHYLGRFSSISWGAIFAGTLLGLTVMAVLNLLGIAIGAATLEAGVAAQGVGIGTGIWWTLTALVGFFVGGWSAGHFSRSQVRSDGLLHGLVTWSAFVVVSLLAVTTTIGQVIGGAFGFMGQNLGAAANMFQPGEVMGAMGLQEGIDPATAAEMEAAAIAAGEQALEAIALGAGWAFVALLLGALVAALGGSFGTIEATERGASRGERFASRLKPSTT